VNDLNPLLDDDAPIAPPPQNPLGRRITTLILVVFVAAGVYGIIDAVGWRAAVGVAVVAVICYPPPVRRVAYWPGLVVIPLVALIGFNVFWGLSPFPHIDLAPGLFFAIVVFAGAAFAYLWLRESLPLAGFVAIPLAVVFVLGAPIVAAKIKEAREKVPTAQTKQFISKLDLLIVVPAHGMSRETSLEPDFAPQAWDIQYSVARVNGSQLRWTLLDSNSPREATRAAEGSGEFVAGSPTLRQGADHALLLDVDGAPPTISDPTALPNVEGNPREIPRWLQIAHLAAPVRVPKFALLQTTDPSRLALWEGSMGKKGGALSIQQFGSQALTDTALHAATTSSTASEDLALALKYRPILLFDAKEPVDKPVDIDSLFAAKRMYLCRDDTTGTHCGDPVLHSSQLVNGSTHLRIDLPKQRKPEHDRTPVSPDELGGEPPPGPTPDTSSAIYVHAVPVESGGRKLVYLDYWWYLPDNPAGTAKGASCGAGLAIPGVTCFDHQSDWEGVTDVVDRTDPEPALVAVQYAQHNTVIRYSWDQLREIWLAPGYAKFKRGIEDAADRPLVFVARGTHASYPEPCPSSCSETESGVGEQPHRGNDAWPGDYTPACTAATCLRPLPSRHHGRQAALWDAYEGTWGQRHCILTYVCDSDTAPRAPGQQGRYQHPWRYTGTVNAKGRFVPAD
jgi:hypothetical protein